MILVGSFTSCFDLVLGCSTKGTVKIEVSSSSSKFSFSSVYDTVNGVKIRLGCFLADLDPRKSYYFLLADNRSGFFATNATLAKYCIFSFCLGTTFLVKDFVRRGTLRDCPLGTKSFSYAFDVRRGRVCSLCGITNTGDYERCFR